MARIISSLSPLLPLAAGLWLRLWQIDLTEFDKEQSAFLTSASAFIDTGQVPLISGPTFNVGIHIPPLVTFIYTLPMLLSRDPAWISAFQASVDALGIAFVYMAVRDIAGRWGGLAAALCYAVLPAAVVYSRLVWNPDLVPFFSAVGLWGAIGFAKDGDSRRLAAAVFAIFCATQLHVSAGIFLPFLAALALARRHDLRFRPLAICAAAIAVVLAPFLWFQVTTGWDDLRAAVAYVNEPKHFATETPALALWLIGGDFRRQIPSHPVEQPAWSLTAEPFLPLLLGLLVLGSAAARRPAGWVLVPWLLLPILVALRTTDAVQPRYLLALLPAAAALTGVGIATVKPRVVGAGLLAALVLFRFWDEARYLASVAELEFFPAYGIPLRYSQEASRLAMQLDNGSSLFVAQPDTLGDFFTYLTGNRIAITRFESGTTLVLRASGGLYVTPVGGKSTEVLDDSFGPPLATVDSPSGRRIYELFRLTPESVQNYLTRLPLHELRADIGHIIQIKGYTQSELVAGRPSSVMLVWEITDPSAGAWPDLHLFGHLVDASGRQWSANPDQRPFPISDWQAGDTVLSWFAVDPPADTPTGGYWLDTGLYQTYLVDRPHVYDSVRDIGPVLRLGPLKVAGQKGPTPVSTLAVLGNAEVGLTSIEVNENAITLTWHSLAKPRGDYTVFVHARDAQGRLVSQHDGRPLSDSYPTTLWDTGETLRDVHLLDRDVTSATTLEIGLYERPTLERLPVSDAVGVPLGDRFIVPIR